MMDEKLLIQRCIKNDRAAQEALYREYFPLIKGMVLRYTQDEDYLISIINDSFLKVFKGIHTFKGQGSFEGWIRRTSYHAICDFFRKENKTKIWKNEINEDVEIRSEALDDLYFLDLMQIVDQLPTTTCQVFKLYALDGFTHKEIGKKLDISDGTSKWHLSEARKKLKVLLHQQKKRNRYARG